MEPDEYDGPCINWRVRDTVLGLHRVRPDLLRVTIEGYGMPLMLQRIIRTDTEGKSFHAYVVMERPELGNFMDPVEAVRAAISTALEDGP